MKAIKYLMGAVIGIASLTACDDNFTNMEPEGFLGQPKTVEASAITSEALPGAIKLKWTVPSDSSFSYMKVSYVNPADGQTVTNVVSVYTDTLRVNNTLKKYGDYTFTFQAYNEQGDAGQPVQVKAQSGLLPATISYTRGDEVKLSADQLSTDDPELTEGPIKNLVDGNANSFFHTSWHSPGPLPHYVQVDFAEPHQTFMVWYKNRSGSQAPPSAIEFQVSSDGTSWETVHEVTGGLPTGSQSEYTSAGVDAGKPFKHFRFVVTATAGNTRYFNLAEMKFYEANKQVYDPENE